MQSADQGCEQSDLKQSVNAGVSGPRPGWLGRKISSLRATLGSRKALSYYFGCTASGVLFSTAILSVFSAVPLLIMGMQFGGIGFALGAAINVAIVYLTAGKIMAAIYTLWVALPALVLRVGVKRGYSLQRNIVLGTLTFILGLCVVAVAASVIQHSSLVEMSSLLRKWAVSWLEEGSRRVDFGSPSQGLDWELALEHFVNELPSSLVIAHLTMVSVSLLTIGRVFGLSGTYTLKAWRMPDLWVWFVIAASLGWLVSQDQAHEVFWNLLRIALAGYLLQGVAILLEVLNAWKFQGIIRWLAFGFAVTMMLPLVLGIGFFDQWFDFRAKIGQS